MWSRRIMQCEEKRNLSLSHVTFSWTGSTIYLKGLRLLSLLQDNTQLLFFVSTFKTTLLADFVMQTWHYTWVPEEMRCDKSCHPQQELDHLILYHKKHPWRRRLCLIISLSIIFQSILEIYTNLDIRLREKLTMGRIQQVDYAETFSMCFHYEFNKLFLNKLLFLGTTSTAYWKYLHHCRNFPRQLIVR